MSTASRKGERDEEIELRSHALRDRGRERMKERKR
jgi:hypothetical protein